MTAAVAATAPVAPKTTCSKTPATAQTKTAASATSDTNPANRIRARPITAGRDRTDQGRAQPATQQPQAAMRCRRRESRCLRQSLIGIGGYLRPMTVPRAPQAAHTPTDASDAGAQATGAVQPQLPSAAADGRSRGSAERHGGNQRAGAVERARARDRRFGKSGKSRFEIRLDPADLGRIDVRIDVDRNGQVTSHLTVEKPETLSMLRQDAPQLQRALDDAGFKTGSGGLQFSLRDQSSSGQNSGNQTSSNAQRLVISEEDTIPAAVAGRTYGRMLGSSSGVDIRV